MSQELAMPGVAQRRGRRRAQVARVGPGTDVGSFVVEAVLGTGGFGTVYRARRGDQLYALKLLELAHVGPSAIREVLSLSRVRHPNVVGLHGFWQWPDEQPRYLVVVMEYVAGRQLDAWARGENPSALGALRLVRDVAGGLAAVHAAGLVHCDVKEANLVVREPRGEGVLVDFGVSSRQRTSPREGGGLPRGTAAYRSPEAWRFGWDERWERSQSYQPTPADDMYALGVVLYWLLTDVQPFDVELSGGVEAVMERAPQPPRERNPQVPEELSQVCLSLLAKRPEERPSAGALLQRAEELLTRQGEVWEQPLCTPFSEHNVTTDLLWPDDWEQWLEPGREQEQRPRRGRRPARRRGTPPPPEAQAAPPDSLPPAKAEAPKVKAAQAAVATEPAPAEPVAAAERKGPAPGHAGPPVRRGAVGGVRVAGGMGLLVALGVLAFALGPLGHGPAAPEHSRPGAGERPGWERELPTWQSGWKVAPPLEPPEAERAAPLETQGAPAAPVAFGATAEEHEASVKTPQQPKRPRAMKKAAALATLCTGLACSGPTSEVRPSPVTAAPCPPGSLEAMEQLGIRSGDTAWSHFPWTWERAVSMKEGWTTRVLDDDLGQLKEGTVLSGRFLLTEKWAHGHFVQATTKEGKTYPVCLQYKETRNDEGQARNHYYVEAVHEFE